MEDHFDDIEASAYSVSLFTDWQNKRINEVWLKSPRRARRQHLNAKPEFFGAKLATKNLHPIAELSAENCTEQMGVAGPWYERLPHFKMGFTPSAGKELQTEYFVPRKHAVEAILAVERLRDQIDPLLMITEIRTIAADNLWMSPAVTSPASPSTLPGNRTGPRSKPSCHRSKGNWRHSMPARTGANSSPWHPQQLHRRYEKLPRLHPACKKLRPARKIPQ